MEHKSGKMENLVNKLYSNYKGARVIVTGHTGFKGSWLTQWLIKMGAEVYGISKEVPKQPSMFADNKLADHLAEDIRLNILDEAALTEAFGRIKPDYIFHLAAQPIVSVSYDKPVETFMINTVGFASILNAARKFEGDCSVVLASSDKCYKNKEWIWGYRENDEFGGNDPYSASKGAAEIVFHSFYHSFYKNEKGKRIASVRAGNVIGGGDWSKDRIIPDAMRAWHKNEEVVVRRPEAVRPWQFVLEPLFGYLLTGIALKENASLNGEGFNFGPDTANTVTVGELLNEVKGHLGYGNIRIDRPADLFYETSTLRINADKAKIVLNWHPVLNVTETTRMIAEWYNAYRENSDLFRFSEQQIEFFEQSINALQPSEANASV